MGIMHAILVDRQVAQLRKHGQVIRGYRMERAAIMGKATLGITGL